MSVLRVPAYAFVFCWVGFLQPAGAHVAVDLQLELVNREIGAHPFQGELYLRRGELLRIRRSFGEALRDYALAYRLDPKLDVVDLCRGRLFLEAEEPAEALAPLDRFLAAHPAHAEARVTRARVLAELGRPLEAAADYTGAIESRPPGSPPAPEHYLERSRALVGAGAEYRDEALRGLEEGIGRLGSAVTLELEALGLELALGRVEAALARLERVSGQWARKDPILARRGEILERAGRLSEACLAYEEALAALEAMPSARRRSPAAVRSGSEIRAALERVRPEGLRRAPEPGGMKGG